MPRGDQRRSNFGDEEELEYEPGMERTRGKGVRRKMQPPGEFFRRVMLGLLLDVILLEEIQKIDRVLDYSCL